MCLGMIFAKRRFSSSTRGFQPLNDDMPTMSTEMGRISDFNSDDDISEALSLSLPPARSFLPSLIPLNVLGGVFFLNLVHHPCTSI